MNARSLPLFGIAITLIGAVLWSSQGSKIEKTDFALTYLGARVVHQKLGAQLYDIGFQRQVRDSLFHNPNPLYYEHPPFEALLFSPLAQLPFSTAYMVWGFINAGLWLTLIFFLRPYFSWPTDELLYFALWLLFAPLGVALYQGQSSLLVLAFYGITYVQLKRRQDFRAGLALGLGLFKFQLVLPFLLIFVFRKKWRFLVGFGCSALLLGILSVAAVGWSGNWRYVQFLFQIANHPQNLSFGSGVDMPTLHGFFYAAFGKFLSQKALSVIVAGASILLLWLVSREWKSQASQLTTNLMFAAAVVVSLLASSHAFTHDLSPLILALFLVGANLSSLESRFEKTKVLRAATVFSLLVFWMFPLYFVCIAWHCLYVMCPILLLLAFSAVAIAKHLSAKPNAELQYVEVR